MATIHPFKGWLPKPEFAADISCPPYDVISTDEARELARNKPNNFLHVIRPEIDLPEGTSYQADEVYNTGAKNLGELLQSDLVIKDEKPAIYIYQLQSSDHKQTGVFTCASVQDYDNNIILKHELTRPDKEDDRTRHILAQKAHAEPVMLTFKDSADIEFLIDKITLTQPAYIEYKADDNVTHKIWKTYSTADFVEAFAAISHLYIADGHHRCKSASRAAEELRTQSGSFPGESEFEYFPVVLFPMKQMNILPYNRVIKHVSDVMINTLQELDMTKTGIKTPDNKGEVSIFYQNEWYSLPLPKAANDNASSTLDVARLQNHVLEPVFGIQNPRTDNNISFVGGVRGTDELEKLVRKGIFDLAISMYPTSIQELVDVSDQGELMPPKSTWFEPKIRSGFVIHSF